MEHRIHEAFHTNLLQALKDTAREDGCFIQDIMRTFLKTHKDLDINAFFVELMVLFKQDRLYSNSDFTKFSYESQPHFLKYS
jgi:hypothetical protein